MPAVSANNQYRGAPNLRPILPMADSRLGRQGELDWLLDWLGKKSIDKPAP
ncbi:MAG: hypothetical protein K0U66_07620 [Gammaproteobacteria bacterium]|nr:hypothetical protein [Gammaproteobacteria bacterium]